MDEGKVIEVEFPLDEPPTLPHRATSGAVIKAAVLRSFEQQSIAEKECNSALDKLVKLVRSIEMEKIPEQLRESLRPALAVNGRYSVKG